MRWYNATGDPIDIESNAGDFLCHPAVPCYYDLAGAEEFHPLSLEVVVQIANPANYNPPCPTPYAMASEVGLIFDEGEVRIPLPNQLGLIDCQPQVGIYSVSITQPTEGPSGTPVTLEWPQVLALLEQCQVKSQKRVDSTTIHLYLSDGTEVHTHEPTSGAIDSPAGRSFTHCPPIEFKQ